jgi:proteasome accessory factor B
MYTGTDLATARRGSALASDRLRRLSRLHTILSELRAQRPCGLASLAARCGCSTKTVQRDLSYLEELGFALRYDAQRRTYVQVGSLGPPLLDLTLAEATALALGSAALSTDAAGLESGLRTAFDKVLALLPLEVAERVTAAQGALLLQPPLAPSLLGSPLLTLLSAQRERRSVRIDYESLSSRRRERLVDPYTLAYLVRFWMLLAYDHDRGEVREFRLDRIHACTLTTQAFALPADWSPSRYLLGSVGVLRGQPSRVRIRFLPEVAPWARRHPWRFPHTLEEEEGGSVLLAGSVSGLEEITKEVLRWGRHAVVLSPPELRQRVADEAEAILGHYRRFEECGQ